MSKRTITVKGVGKASLPPDYIEVPLYLESQKMEYDQAIELSKQKMSALEQCLGAIGFQKESLKTVSFNVDTNYENVQNELGQYVHIFQGYTIRHQLLIGFNFNHERLQEVMEAISGCSAHPEFSIRYGVKDESFLTSLILQDAVKQAKMQAEVLAKAAGVSLGEIQSIQYDTNSSQPYLNELSLTKEVVIMDIYPQDVEAMGEVTIVWQLV